MALKISRRARVAAAASAALLVLTACSSSGGSSGSSSGGSSGSAGSSGGASGSPITVGVITDSTGAAASGYQNTEKGIKAYVNAVNADGGVNGHPIKYVMADSTSTPVGARTAAQKLVQVDKVFAIISVTSNMFGAEEYLLKQGVPVVGTGFDGPEWTDPKNTNMFVANGVVNPSDVFSTAGQTVKKLGGTSCGSVGYLESPSASKSAVAFVKSCAAAGLKNAYTTNIHFGTTDVGPIALAMKNKGVDSAFLATVVSTGFALSAALKQQGVQTKAFLLPTGYGGELLASKTDVQAAQGFYFEPSQQPVEMQTPATKLQVQRLAAVGEHNVPDYAESTAYVGMTAFARGLKEAGANPTQQSFMEGLRKVTDFDAEGLLAPMKINFNDYAPTKQCSWLVQLKGNKFVTVPGLDPICGTKLSSG